MEWMRGEIRAERRVCLSILLRVQPGGVGDVCVILRGLQGALRQ